MVDEVFLHTLPLPSLAFRRQWNARHQQAERSQASCGAMSTYRGRPRSVTMFHVWKGVGGTMMLLSAKEIEKREIEGQMLSLSDFFLLVMPDICK